MPLENGGWDFFPHLRMGEEEEEEEEEQEQEEGRMGRQKDCEAWEEGQITFLRADLRSADRVEIVPMATVRRLDLSLGVCLRESMQKDRSLCTAGMCCGNKTRRETERVAGRGEDSSALFQISPAE